MIDGLIAEEKLTVLSNQWMNLTSESYKYRFALRDCKITRGSSRGRVIHQLLSQSSKQFNLHLKLPVVFASITLLLGLFHASITLFDDHFLPIFLNLNLLKLYPAPRVPALISSLFGLLSASSALFVSQFLPRLPKSELI